MNEPNSSRKYLWLLLFIILICIVGAGIAVTFFKKEKTGPPVLTANFIDASKIEKISKFRSCQGHTVVPQNESESKRNMKHYLVVLPEYTGKQVEVYAPFNGIVNSIGARPEQGLEGEIWLGVRGSEWAVSFQHLYVLDTLTEGQKIKAGDLIGHIANKGIDLVYAVGSREVKMIDGYASPYSAIDSIFSHMTDQVFNEYVGEHVKTRDDLIWTKAYRDQNPCEYRNTEGGLNDIAHPEDWVVME
ncbi:MAG: hypothetical protein WC289_05070 [Patescibacteria group bacterium]